MSNTAKATISLNAKPFEDGAKAAIKAAEKMSSAIGDAMSTALGVIGGGIALQGINKLANGIKDLATGGIAIADQMADLAASTGMAADEALRYDFALKNGLSSGAAEALMGSASKNIGQTAENFRGIRIRMEAIWMNLQGVFTRIANFFSPVIDQILAMAENVDWDAWAESAEAFLKPVKNGIMALIQLATEGRIWEVAGKTMELGFAMAGNVLNHGIDIAKNSLPALGEVLVASLKTGANAFVYIGKLAKNILSVVFDDLGKGFGSALIQGFLAVGSKITSLLINMVMTPFAYLTASITKLFEELMENLPDFLKPDSYKDYKAHSFEDALKASKETYQETGIAKMFDDQAKELGERAKSSFGELGVNIKEAIDQTKFEDITGAGDSLSMAMEKFGTAVTDTKFLDKFGVGDKKDELAKILKDAFDRINTEEKPDTKSIKGITPVFGSADSLASVGGGGGVGTGIMGVLDESRRQTRLQEQMVGLLQGSGTVEGASPLQTGKLSWGF